MGIRVNWRMGIGIYAQGGMGDMDKCVRESLNRIVKKDKDTRSALNRLSSRKHLQPRSELHYPISTRVIASWLVRGYIVSRMRWYGFGNRAICQCEPGEGGAAAQRRVVRIGREGLVILTVAMSIV